VGSLRGEAESLYQLARLERQRNDLARAREHIEAALRIVETLRAKVFNQQLRTSYFATVQDYYKLYIDLLMLLHKRSPAEGHDGAALQASERGRARSLIELLREAGADIREGVDPKLLERERALQRQLNEKAEAQTRLLAGRHTPEEAAAATRELDALADEYERVETEIRRGRARATPR
jgi:hypothetical protein